MPTPPQPPGSQPASGASPTTGTAARYFTVSGRARGAHKVTVTLTRSGHVYARAKALLEHGRNGAVLNIVTLAPGRYTVKVKRFMVHSTSVQRWSIRLSG